MKQILSVAVRYFLGTIIKDNEVEIQETFPGFWHILAEYFTHE